MRQAVALARVFEEWALAALARCEHLEARVAELETATQSSMSAPIFPATSDLQGHAND